MGRSESEIDTKAGTGGTGGGGCLSATIGSVEGEGGLLERRGDERCVVSFGATLQGGRGQEESEGDVCVLCLGDGDGWGRVEEMGHRRKVSASSHPQSMPAKEERRKEIRTFQTTVPCKLPPAFQGRVERHLQQINIPPPLFLPPLAPQ